MFTGIIEAIGRVEQLQERGGDLRICVNSGALDLGDVKLGDSIATNGVCLTVVELTGSGYWADVSQETLAHSTFPQLQVGAALNLEKAMQAGARFGGHMVSGHIDGVATVVEIRPDGRSTRYTLEAPAELAHYIAHKGSVTIDGVSLTVNRIDGARFELNIVPHTQQETIISGYTLGQRINLEVDLVARYLERLLQGPQAQQAEPASKVDENFLAQHGFLGRART